MSFGYTIDTQFSQSESHTKGSSDINSPLRMTESATYDFNTGAMKTSTDFNGRMTTTDYDAVLRPTLVTLPTGATTNISYSDASLESTQTVQLPDTSHTIVSETFTRLNGRGQRVYSKYLADATHWNASSVQYDVMGRKWKEFVPYDSGASAGPWTEYSYDALSRVTQVATKDQNGTAVSTSTTAYNETTARPDGASSNAGQTVRTTDAWGRQRWARTDAFGRLVEVVEPNPTGDGSLPSTSGSGNLPTTYAYDPLDRLTTVTQGSQTRSFKYDSLGRLTRQKLAEQTATINDGGVYVGAGGTGALWSDAFTYDSRSNITQRVDARGVKTIFSYGSPDPLNRLQSISYDTSTADQTYYTLNNAPTVSISYMTTGDKTRVYQVVTSGVATETNGYNDSEFRLTDYTLTLTTRSSYPMQTSYSYDTANRLTQVTYPARYGMPGGTQPGKVVTPTYDQASRLKDVTVDTQAQLSVLNYNALSQVTSLRTGPASGTTDANETYTYDNVTGLLTGQTVTRTSDSQTLLNLSYSYARGNSNGNLNGKTGQLTSITNNLDHNKDRSFEFDALGRLKAAKGGGDAGAIGVTANWTQTYAFDRYGNKTSVAATGITADSNAVPTDGLSTLAYDTTSNRLNTTGWQYDNAGNLVRGQNQNGVWQRFEYDAAGRLAKIKDDANNPLETYTYGADRNRLTNDTGSQKTYYVWGGSSVIQEYTEATGTTAPVYSKSYVYAGSRLLSTATNVSGTEVTEFHHPDRLGTKVVTKPGATPTSYEQSTLPFGAALNAESTGYSNQTFTSYDRSASTGLDYAVNRTYSSGQGRFIQVDPAGEGLNLYAYVGNDPINLIDPSGLNMAGPGTRYGPYDPMGIAYYVDGVLSDAYTVWSIIGAGAYDRIESTVPEVTWSAWGHYENDQFVRDHEVFHVWGSGDSQSSDEGPAFWINPIRLLDCAKKSVLNYFKAVGTTDEGIKQMQKALDKLRVSFQGFPVDTPPGAVLASYALTGHPESATGILGYTANERRIYFANDLKWGPASFNNAYAMSKLVHEFTHIMQYLNEPFFRSKYIKEAVSNGTGPGNAWEDPAYALEADSERWFKENPNALECK